MDRKAFLHKAFQLAVGKGLEALTENRVVQAIDEWTADEPPRTVVRPPGAHPSELEFLQRCTGCDQCMIACPRDVVMVEDIDRRDPVILEEPAPCESCSEKPCIPACPTSALSWDHLA